jgi:capsular exopolysaccharide synthesis family protein
MTETDGSTSNGVPPKEVLQVAARSVAEGASLASVAAWFRVPESQLQQWIASHADQPTANGAVSQLKSEPINHFAPVSPVKTETAPRRPAVMTPRPASARPDAPTYPPEGTFRTGRRLSHPSPIGVRGPFSVLRRRLLVVVAGAALGASAGWFTAPGETRRAVTFQASHTVIYESQGAQSYNIDQVALLATSGDVPSRVAARLNMDRGQVRSAVSAVAAAEVGTIAISARGSSPDRAESLANLTAEELGAQITGNAQAEIDADLGRLRDQVDSARGRLNAIPAKNTAERANAQAELSAAERALQQFEATHTVKPHLRSLEPASATTVGAPGVQAPNSKPVRAGLLGAIGLLAGIGAAFGLDRLDTRIRSKATAEDAFGMPVVAEVPRAPKGADGQLLARTQPSSPIVEAYRGLRTYVALWAPDGQEDDDGHRVIVVTSPSAGEGKTTTVANLAAMLAEIGRSVVVVSADLRRPRIHELFDRAAAPGLVDVLAAAPGAPAFDDLDLGTSVRGVRLVSSGPPIENPAPLLEHAGDLIRAVRKMADFVLVDTPPLLVANDAVDLARYADGVLLVAHAGKTPIEAAEHSAQILKRLDIPAVGVVLVASEEASSASRYYASRYYASPERKGRRRPWPSDNDGERPTTVPPAPEETSPAITSQWSHLDGSGTLRSDV